MAGGSEPLLQFMGTVITVFGGIIVAYVTTRRGKKKLEEDLPTELGATPASRKDLVKLHSDVLGIAEDLEKLISSFADFWQWERDRHQTWKDRWDVEMRKEKP